jgi:acyl-CoA reductase-like NAD-dependent aldehyde dehydrogenase
MGKAAKSELKAWLVTYSQIYLMSKVADNLLGEPEIHYEPKGVVLVIGAWNYPAMLVFQPAAEAIAAGLLKIMYSQLSI